MARNPALWIGNVKGTPQHDDDGNIIVRWATCGTCGRTWNDALITGITPTPSGRCPFEYDHKDEGDDWVRETIPPPRAMRIGTDY